MVQGSFGFWFLPSFDHRCHLKSRVPPHPWDLVCSSYTSVNSNCTHGAGIEETWPWSFKQWISLSMRQTTIHWISIRKNDCAFNWTEIYMYPVDIIIHLLDQLRSRWDKAIILFDISKHCLINWDKVKEIVIANWTLVYFCLLGNFANLKLYGYKIAPYFFFPLLVQFWTQKNSHLPYWFFHPASICEWRQGNCW